MKLIYKEDYKSITQFNDVMLENFTVLTGVNGSGKSHLLEAIRDKKIYIENLEESYIVFFDYSTFILENEGKFNIQNIYQQQDSAWDIISNFHRTGYAFGGHNLRYDSSEANEVLHIIKNVAIEKDKNLLELQINDFPTDVLERVVSNIPLESLITSYLEQKKQEYLQIKKDNPSVYKVIKKLDYFIHDITKDEFNRLYEPHTTKNSFLPNQIGGVFWDYYVKYKSNRQDKFDKSDGIDVDFLTDEEFISKYGAKPWDIVNSILEDFQNLDYRVNNPLDEKLHYIRDSFQLKLTNIRTGVEVNFQDLSSGEKILMALVVSRYKTYSDNAFPDILLLDEIDASLHPSMIENLLDVIKNVFLANGMKVIMVTHSPSTIALSPEESIFVMNKEGEDRIDKSSKEKALYILTKGFATLDSGLKLFDEIAQHNLTLITEGKNTNFIKKAFELYGIKDVHIMTGIESISGKDQLKTLYDFFTKIPHENKVLFVWDCDVHKYRDLDEENNTHVYVFDINDENTIAQKGIENLFDEEHFGIKFIKEVIVAGEVKERLFADNKKNEFIEYVLARNNKEDFKNFQPLFEKIENLLTI